MKLIDAMRGSLLATWLVIMAFFSVILFIAFGL